MAASRPEEYGLSETIVDEIRAREQRQFELFVKMTGAGSGVAWLLFTVFLYSHSFRQAPLLGLAAAPLLALAGAVVSALPIAIACGLGVLLLYRRHPKARALERYEADTTPVRQCEVCVLARGDLRLREGVVFCARCDAWICPECRVRYDLRAIAALRARAKPKPDQGSAPGSDPKTD
jgi:hypothetical protein